MMQKESRKRAWERQRDKIKRNRWGDRERWIDRRKERETEGERERERERERATVDLTEKI